MIRITVCRYALNGGADMVDFSMINAATIDNWSQDMEKRRKGRVDATIKSLRNQVSTAKKGM